MSPVSFSFSLFLLGDPPRLFSGFAFAFFFAPPYFASSDANRSSARLELCRARMSAAKSFVSPPSFPFPFPLPFADFPAGSLAGSPRGSFGAGFARTRRAQALNVSCGFAEPAATASSTMSANRCASRASSEHITHMNTFPMSPWNLAYAATTSSRSSSLPRYVRKNASTSSSVTLRYKPR